MNPMATTNGVILDSLVRTADGVELGRVKEIRRSQFKLDAAHRPDYWLSGADIEQLTPDGVIVRFVAVDLAYHEIDDLDGP